MVFHKAFQKADFMFLHEQNLISYAQPYLLQLFSIKIIIYESTQLKKKRTLITVQYHYFRMAQTRVPTGK